jgi:lipopolysaccharide export LptBFGC system permease protein LptF
VLRTLHGYLCRELLRVSSLALVAFTLVMTVFAIIEPLRKRGLATGQVAMLFGYTLPVMLSLTLPFAALFATAIVYGRFSADREMLACRASGISTVKLLYPAVALGAIVTLLSLTLTNFVSPHMARKGEQAVVENIKQIIFHKIKKEGYVRFGSGNKYMVHATRVDEENDALVGVVFYQSSYGKDPQTGQMIPVTHAMVASTAYLDTFKDESGTRHFISVLPVKPAGPISSRPGGVGKGEEVVTRNIELPSQARDKPTFYDWESLIATLHDPTRQGEINKGMKKVKRMLRMNQAMVGLAGAVNAGLSYDALGTSEQKFSVRAAKAVAGNEEAQLAGGKAKDGSPIPVSVRVTPRDGGQPRTYTADTGKVTVSWNPIWQRNFITIELKGNIRVPIEGTGAKEAPRKSDMSWGQIPLPPNPKIDNVSLKDIFENPRQFTDDVQILAHVDLLKDHRAPKVRGEIISEMHARIAFGLSCVLLVAMGGALGVIFKGGNLLTAFAVSILPAAAVLVMILMGKKMISNPKSSDYIGILAIWGGLLALLVADVIVYYRLSRK